MNKKYECLGIWIQEKKNGKFQGRSKKTELGNGVDVKGGGKREM